MDVFVFEHFSAMTDDDGSLRHEGTAMRDAVVHDLQRLDGLEVRTMDAADATCDQRPALFRTHCERADLAIVVAPETDGLLEDYLFTARRYVPRLLNATAEVVAWASDKQRTAEQLATVGVPTPGPSGPPWICKPVDGAGGDGVRLTLDPADRAQLAPGMRLESFHRGIPSSISMLMASDGPRLLPPVRQHFRSGTFAYAHGSLWNDEQVSERLVRLVRPLLPLFHGCRGWLGIDVIVGDAADGSADVVVEVNPRLTSSYLELRKRLSVNLAQWMLAGVLGAGEARR